MFKKTHHFDKQHILFAILRKESIPNSEFSLYQKEVDFLIITSFSQSLNQDHKWRKTQFRIACLVNWMTKSSTVFFFIWDKLQNDVVMIPTQWYLDARTNRNSKGRIRFENLLLASGNSDVVIPINKINHWCLVFLKNGVGVWYNSLEFQEADHEVIETVESVIQIKRWFHLQGRKQTNSIDCGVHMLATAWNLCQRSESTKSTTICQLRYWIASHCARIKIDRNQTKPKICKPAKTNRLAKRTVKKISCASNYWKKNLNIKVNSITILIILLDVIFILLWKYYWNK